MKETRDEEGAHGQNPFVPGDTVARDGDIGTFTVILSKRDTIVMKPSTGDPTIISDNFWHYRKV